MFHRRAGASSTAFVCCAQADSRVSFHFSKAVSLNAVIASQCAHWRGNPFPLMQSIFSEILRKLRRFGYGLPRRFAPRNDSAGRNPVIKMRVLTKTDSHKIILQENHHVKGYN